MNTPKFSRPSAVGGFSAEEAKRIVEAARAKGLIRDTDPLPKDGDQAAQEGSLRTLWMDVTPDIARRWLENNLRNRAISEDVVAGFAREMANGSWVATHQGIAFSVTDALIDGQHRLTAIVRTGITVRMMVTFGLPEEVEGKEMKTMDAVDRGRPRSVADQLKIQHGLKGGSIIAAIAMNLGGLCWQRRTRRLSVAEVLEIYRAFEPAIAHVVERRPTEHGMRAAGVLAGFAFAIAAEHAMSKSFHGKTTAMFEQLRTGEGLRRGGAIAALRAFLVSDAAALLNRGTDRGIAELVLQAIWLEHFGRNVAKLEPGTDGLDYFRGLQRERAEKISRLFEAPTAAA